MEKETKNFIIRGIILVGVFLAVTFLFRFPIDLFHLKLFRMTEATRVFSKSDGLKIFALAGIFFTLYFQHRIAKVRQQGQPLWRTILLGVAGFLLVAGYYGLRYLSNAYQVTEGPWFYAIYASSLVVLTASFLFFSASVFSPGYIMRFFLEFRKELAVTAIASVVAYNLLMLFQEQWLFFSSTVTLLLVKLFNPLFPTVYDLSGPSPLLKVADFTVSIGPPCSGIESMFLFVAFSLGIFALDHKRLKKLLFFVVSLVGFVGVYFVNVIRLFLLMLAGIYVSPEFSVGLFHTNIGWLLFVIYFLCYYLVMKRFIYVDDSTRKEKGAQAAEASPAEEEGEKKLRTR
ncbi:exosortase/archaeosortase family protein [Candidatus Woesearchaeota archaeon]|nr:exosortase/archaeosortase family protein [Candidatus Woesearchaeota archaeon]